VTWAYVGSTVAFVLTLALAVINSLENPDSADAYIGVAYASAVIWMAVILGLFNGLSVLPDVAFGLTTLTLLIELNYLRSIMLYKRPQRPRGGEREW